MYGRNEPVCHEIKDLRKIRLCCPLASWTMTSLFVSVVSQKMTDFVIRMDFYWFWGISEYLHPVAAGPWLGWSWGKVG